MRGQWGLWLLFGLVVTGVPLLFYLVVRRGAADEEAPLPVEDAVPGDVETPAAAAMSALIQQIEGSDYARRLNQLGAFSAGRVVRGSETGNAGFILLLDNGSWVASFRDKHVVGFAYGHGEPTQEVRSAITSSAYGDASEPVPANIFRGTEPCNIQDEVMHAHGGTIAGLSIGLNAFNFAFDDDYELGVKLVDDKHGRPAFRVYWEQW